MSTNKEGLVNYNLTGVDSTLKALRRRRSKYKIYNRRIMRSAQETSMKIARDNWFAVDKNVIITTEPSSTGFVLRVSGEDVLFLEFGAGILYSSASNPLAAQMGYGPGTYPGKGHWNNPNGWFYYSEDPEKIIARNSSGRGIAKSYGNPAFNAMYNTAQELKDVLPNMVIEELRRK